MQAIVPAQTTPLAPMSDTAEQSHAYVEQSSAANTRRAYQSDWRIFVDWCDAHQMASLPATPETVALFVTEQAQACKVATLERRLVAISQAHQLAGYESPTKREAVRRVMKGIRRVKGTAQVQKTAATTDVVRLMVATCSDDMTGLRDRALLLIGFAGAFRRSELVGLDVADLSFTQQGVVILLRRSKTDQEGQGEKKAIPYGMFPATCPVRALEHWLEASGITRGPVFRRVYPNGRIGHDALSAYSVALIVKQAAAAAGLDPAQFAGHSLRAGLATAAAQAGVEERDIMKQTGHKSERIVRRYIREGNLFRNNAAGQVGL